MKDLLKTVAVTAAGAAAMYYLDPEMGHRRRAQARGRLETASRDVERYAQAESARTAERAEDWMASASLPFMTPSPARSDRRLQKLIRAQLRRTIEHPKAVDVDVTHGRVRLDGHVPERELAPLLATVSAIPGVQDIDNRLLVHDQAGQVHQQKSRRSMLPLMALATPLAVMLSARRYALRNKQQRIDFTAH